MFVVKSRAKGLSVNKLKPTNVRSGLAFQPHFAGPLNDHLHRRLEKGWPAGAAEGKLSVVHSSWVTLEYAERLNCHLHEGERELGAVQLPLPTHWVKNAEEMATNCQPRTLYNAASFTEPQKLVKDVAPLPRCGQSGYFFVKEEVVDNLMTAATVLDLKSPFWIREEHPELQSGYLQLLPNAIAVTLPLTALVFFAAEAPLPKELQPFAGASAGPCTNAFTGAKCKTPWVEARCEQLGSTWYTLDQCRYCWGAAARASSKAPDALEAWEKGVLGSGVIVELDQWDLYNAASLVQPGRLALDRATTIGQLPATLLAS